MDEKLYGIQEICTLLSLSARRARALFVTEPGVLSFRPPGDQFPDVQVPQSILVRVLRRSAVPGAGADSPENWEALLNGESTLYKIPKLGSSLNIGESKARRQFQHEPGVLHLMGPGDKRPTIRVPSWVLERVLRRSAVPQPLKRG